MEISIQKIFIFIHVISASIWVGGHIILLIGILPKALKNKDSNQILEFEKKYEKIGMPALILQILTGIHLSFGYGIKFNDWFSFSNHYETILSIKLILLILTFLFALSARLLIIPKLNSKNLNLMAFHILMVTIFSVLFVYFGISFRF